MGSSGADGRGSIEMASCGADDRGCVAIEGREDVVEIIWGGGYRDDNIEAMLERHTKITERLSNISDKQPSATIFKVPPQLRGEDTAAAYEPKVISIGPYHRSKVDEKDADEFGKTHVLKAAYLKKFLKITGGEIGDLRTAMAAMEARARDCYSKEELYRLKKDQFVEMLLLDGCFLLCHLCGYRFGDAAQSFRHLECDLLLLENQIPFFVLNKLHESLPKSEDVPSPLIDVVIRKFYNQGFVTEITSAGATESELDEEQPRASVCLKMLSFLGFSSGNLEGVTSAGFVEEWIKTIPTEKTDLESYHLLDIFHYCIRPKHPKEEALREAGFADDRATSIPTATELHDKGINFGNNGEEGLDLRFKNGDLELPLLKVNEDTIVLLQNLIALEKCRPRLVRHVGNYVRFMSFLVKNHADVALLRQKGVLVNGLGSDEEVAKSFVKLSKNVPFDSRENRMKKLMVNLNTRYRRRASRWMAEFSKNYFGSPWKIASVVAASIFLGTTIAQLVFAVLSYRKGLGGSG